MSTPEQPGTVIFHTDHVLGFSGQPAKVIVTRADRWILVNREFMARLRDEGAVDHGPLFFAAGYPDSVKYRFVRKFDEHSDVYERIDSKSTSASDEGITDLDPMVAELLASNPPIEKRDDARMAAEPAPRFGNDEALREITQQAMRSAARVDELNEELTKAGERNRLLTEVLNEVLGSFTQQGHPGEPCLRTGWIGTRTVARWRRIAAGRPSFDELLEQLTGVELTDEQRALLRKIWSSRAVERPVDVTSVGYAGSDVLRTAMAQLLEISRRYDA